MNLLLTGAIKYSEEQLLKIKELGFEITYIQDERIPLSELFKILETVKANEAERQDSLPESAMTQFSVRDIGMEAANLILAGRLGYRWKAQYMDDYGMWILGEKDGEDNEAEA